jgi:hypothetical protein
LQREERRSLYEREKRNCENGNYERHFKRGGKICFLLLKVLRQYRALHLIKVLMTAGKSLGSEEGKASYKVSFVISKLKNLCSGFKS